MKSASADSMTVAVAGVDTSAGTSLTDTSVAATVTTDIANCVQMHFATDSAVLEYEGERGDGSVLVQDHDENTDAALELLCSTYTAVSTADIVAPLLATTHSEVPPGDGVTVADGADGDAVVRDECSAVLTSTGATETGGVTRRVPDMAGTATTEERWEVPLRAALFLQTALFLPADC
jgi:hypothetical protein